MHLHHRASTCTQLEPPLLPPWLHWSAQTLCRHAAAPPSTMSQFFGPLLTAALHQLRHRVGSGAAACNVGAGCHVRSGGPWCSILCSDSPSNRLRILVIRRRGLGAGKGLLRKGRGAQPQRGVRMRPQPVTGRGTHLPLHFKHRNHRILAAAQLLPHFRAACRPPHPKV